MKIYAELGLADSRFKGILQKVHWFIDLQFCVIKSSSGYTSAQAQGKNKFPKNATEDWIIRGAYLYGLDHLQFWDTLLLT